MLVAGDDALVFYVQSDSARHFENSVRSADRVDGPSLAGFLIAPYAEIRHLSPSHCLVERTIGGKNEFLLRIDGKRSAQRAGPSYHILRFRVTAGRAIEYQKASLTTRPVTATSACSDNQKVVDVVDSKSIHNATRIRSFEDAFGRNVSVCHAVIDQDSVAFRNEDFIIHRIDHDAVRSFKTCL